MFSPLDLKHTVYLQSAVDGENIQIYIVKHIIEKKANLEISCMDIY